MTDSDNSEIYSQIQHLIGHGKIRDAVEYLNLSSPYRFTALFRITSDNLQNLVIYDREAPDQPPLDTIPLGDSYCVFVRDLKDAFIVSDSQSDARVVDHPKRPTVHAYCGVPLTSMSGEVCGTVCHFDFEPVSEDPAALAALEKFASLLDPSKTSEALERGITVKVNALEAMLSLFAETSENIAEATIAFEEFARPVRSSAMNLTEAAMRATNARIDSLLANLPAMIGKSAVAC